MMSLRKFFTRRVIQEERLILMQDEMDYYKHLEREVVYNAMIDLKHSDAYKILRSMLIDRMGDINTVILNDTDGTEWLDEGRRKYLLGKIAGINYALNRVESILQEKKHNDAVKKKEDYL